MSAHQSPVGAAWYHGRHRQCPAEFFEQAVGLAVVADGAGRDAVLPDVLAAAAAGHHVVDGFRAAAAVGAAVVIAAHQRGPGQRHTVAVGHPDVAAEPDHRWRRQHDGGSVQDRPVDVVVDNLGLAAEYQAHGAAEAHGGQRFIRHVEQQHSSHRTSRWRRLAQAHAPSVSPATRFCHQISVQGRPALKVRAWSSSIRRRGGRT